MRPHVGAVYAKQILVDHALLIQLDLETFDNPVQCLLTHIPTEAVVDRLPGTELFR